MGTYYGGIGMGLTFRMVWEWGCYFEMGLVVKVEYRSGAGTYGNGSLGMRLTVV